MAKKRSARNHDGSRAVSFNKRLAASWSEYIRLDGLVDDGAEHLVEEASQREIELSADLDQGFRKGLMTPERIFAIGSKEGFPQPDRFVRKLYDHVALNIITMADDSFMQVEAFVIPLVGLISNMQPACRQNLQKISEAVRGSGYSQEASNVAIMDTVFSIDDLPDIEAQALYDTSLMTLEPARRNRLPLLDATDVAEDMAGVRFLVGFRAFAPQNDPVPDGFYLDMFLSDEDDAQADRLEEISEEFERLISGKVGEAVIALPPIPWMDAATELLSIHLEQKLSLISAFGSIERSDQNLQKIRLKLSVDKQGLHMQFRDGSDTVLFEELVSPPVVGLAGMDLLEMLAQDYRIVSGEPEPSAGRVLH